MFLTADSLLCSALSFGPSPGGASHKRRIESWRYEVDEADMMIASLFYVSTTFSEPPSSSVTIQLLLTLGSLGTMPVCSTQERQGYLLQTARRMHPNSNNLKYLVSCSRQEIGEAVREPRRLSKDNVKNEDYQVRSIGISNNKS